MHDAVVHLTPAVTYAQTQHKQSQQGAVARCAVLFTVNACFGRQCRHHRRAEDRQRYHKQDIQPHQQQTGDQGARVHVTHGSAQLVSQNDQHQGGWNGLRQSARGRDHACSNHTAVAVAQHDGQRNQTHRNHRRSDHTCGGCQQCTHQNHGNGHAATHRAKHLAHGFQQIFGHA